MLTRRDLIEVPVAAAGQARMTRIDLPPGASAGLHRHPCDVVGYVLTGTIRYRLEGEPERILHAGDAFHEPKNARVAHFDNVSDTETATFLACYLMAPGSTEVIEMLG